jgi:ABC-type nitrate/sulfonate/bicarbonate transport system substrate-binding protein
MVLSSLILFSYGCAKNEEGKNDTARHRLVAVGSQWYGHIPVWVGIERGIFKEAGFDVEWRFIGKSMDRLNAISSDEAQFASLGEIAMLSATKGREDRLSLRLLGRYYLPPALKGARPRPRKGRGAGEP